MSLRFVFTILALYKFVCMYVCKNGRCMYVKSVYLTIRHHCICTVTERYNNNNNNNDRLTAFDPGQPG